MIRPDKTLDVTGLLSPRPETITGNTLSAMEPGCVLTVITTDAAATRELRLLCERLGHTLLGLEEDRGTFFVHIRKSATADGHPLYSVKKKEGQG